MQGKMRMALAITYLITACLWGISPKVRASEFSCGSSIIAIGDRKFDVMRKCGEPAYKRVWQEERIARNLGGSLPPPEESRSYPILIKKYVVIEEWEYNFGPTAFIRYLRFENDILTRITIGDYGY
jgi:hypothetical protein